MASSSIQICNIALGHLGANPIMSFQDGIAEANLCSTFYDQARQKILEDAEWSFAVARREVARSATPPIFGYTNQFKLPADCLKVLEAFDKSTMSSNPSISPNDTQWEVESGYIMCDAEILMIRYTKDVTDTALFSAGYAQTLGAYLAYQMAGKLAGARGLKSDMWTLFNAELQMAKSSDGIQGRTRVIRSSRLVTARNR